MLTTREISEEGFTVKNRDWNKKELLQQWREQWAVHANQSLEREGIQDRITHESHEKRKLIIFPTVHLGHVAHEMEKRGVQTDRGTINRDRQEYNRLVVDLQTYREEKKALEQEKARKQEQRQQSECFNTPAERVHLQEASKLLNLDRELTLKEIFVKRKELDKWENQVPNDDQQIRWKDETIRGTSETYRWIHIFENQRQQAQDQLEHINWINPFKLKENRMTKEQAERDMSKAEDQITSGNKTLDAYREKLGFHTEKEFQQVQRQHQTDYPGLLEKNRQIRGHIHQERKVLEKAETAHQNAFVRQVASLYSKRTEMRYISLKTAKRLMDMKQANGNQVVPIETIQNTLNNRKEDIQRLHGEIDRVNRQRSRLQRAEGYLNNYEKYHALVEKIENNPFLKGKLLVSKSAKQEYDQAISTRETYQDSMKKEGVSGRKDLEKQFHNLGKVEAGVPAFKDQIQSQEKGIDLLDAIMKGVEQAGRNMQREQKLPQQHLAKTKNKGKIRHRGWEMER